MTDENAGTAAPSRGRPRPADTIERDKLVLGHLRSATAGQTNKAIGEALGLESNQVYLSLYRLKRDGEAVRTGGTWTAVNVEPAAPAE